jgi:hypothetical protein
LVRLIVEHPRALDVGVVDDEVGAMPCAQAAIYSS